MKQRSPTQTLIPKQFSLPNERSDWLHESREANPCGRGRNKLLRRKLYNIYKTLKQKDREIGLKKNNLFKEFFYELAQIRAGDASDEAKKYLGDLAKQIKELSEIARFRKDFPSFAMFKRFVLKENLTLKELVEMSGE